MKKKSDIKKKTSTGKVVLKKKRDVKKKTAVGEDTLKKKTERYLEKLYTNLDNNPDSFSSVKQIYKKGRLFDPDLTYEKVSRFLSRYKSYSLYKPARVNYKRAMIRPKSIDHTWALDSAYVTNLAKFNDDFKYIFVVVDLFSKYAWAKPMKTLTSRETADKFKEIFFENHRSPTFLWSDAGTEMAGEFAKLIKMLGIKRYTTGIGGSKSVVAERFIRTLKSKLGRVFEAKKSYRWIDFLPQIMVNYNKRPHSTTKIPPDQVKSDVETAKINAIYDDKIDKHTKKKMKYKVGDYV